MDLIDTQFNEIKKLKVKELKKLIIEQNLFDIDKKDKKNDLLKKIENLKKEYEDSDSDDTNINDLTEKIDTLNVNKFEKKNLKQNYILFNNNMIYEIFQILKDLIDECKISFDNKGFKINTIDKYLVSLIDINIENCYKDYNFLDGKFDIIINIQEFIKILDCKENTQNIKFLFKEDYVEIYFYNSENDNLYDKFKLRYLDENLIQDSSHDNIFQFNNNIEMNSRYFSKLCNKIKKFDEKIIFEIKDNNLKFSSNNEDIEINNLLESNYDDIKMKFFLKHILIFCKTEKLCNDVKIFFNEENFPIQFLYKIDDSEIKYLITPSIEDY